MRSFRKFRKRCHGNDRIVSEHPHIVHLLHPVFVGVKFLPVKRERRFFYRGFFSRRGLFFIRVGFGKARKIRKRRIARRRKLSDAYDVEEDRHIASLCDARDIEKRNEVIVFDDDIAAELQDIVGYDPLAFTNDAAGFDTVRIQRIHHIFKIIDDFAVARRTGCDLLFACNLHVIGCGIERYKNRYGKRRVFIRFRRIIARSVRRFIVAEKADVRFPRKSFIFVIHVFARCIFDVRRKPRKRVRRSHTQKKRRTDDRLIIIINFFYRLH